jgi:hypothetical protein
LEKLPLCLTSRWLWLLNDLDIKTSFEGNVIKVYPGNCWTQRNDSENPTGVLLTFSLVALSETASTLSSYKETSLQGDSALGNLQTDGCWFSIRKITVNTYKGY